MLFDIHTHCFPDTLAPRAIGKLAFASGGLMPYTDGTLSSLDALMHAQGVDAFAVQNIATNPRQMKKVNDFAASIQCDHIYPFGSVHPDAPDALEELSALPPWECAGSNFTRTIRTFLWTTPNCFPCTKKHPNWDL